MNIFHTIIAEDVGGGDITGEAVVSPAATASGHVVAKMACVVTGLEPASRLYRAVDSSLVWQSQTHDGERIAAGQELAVVHGNARALLRGERVVLNLLQHLCGVATLTRHFVDAVAGTNIIIRDTRKTLPGLRAWQKAAVVAGGGVNHRMGLDDQYLIKSNHVAMHGSLATALAYFAKHRRAGLPCEIEIRTLEEIDIALAANPDWILLDNFSPEQIRAAVTHIAGRAKIEVSGGITLTTVRDYALPGVNALAIGALTHSTPAVDLHLPMHLTFAFPFV